MKNNLNILFLTTLILGTLISISSTNWLGIWMGLELNMLSFIPILASSKNIISSETSIKYFLIQTIASLIFISFALTNSLLFLTLNNFLLSNFLSFFMNMALLLKLGAAPFQSWFISIMSGLSWVNCFILMTWQKITPLCVMFYLIFNQKFILVFSVLSLLVGSIGGMNQSNLKKIFGFSSVNHLGWMFASFLVSKTLFIIYFLIYIFMNFSIVFITNFFNFSFISHTFLINLHWPFMVNLMSLGGLPPFLGFLPKLLVVQNLVKMSNLFITFIMLMTTLLTLFYYLRLIYPSLLINYFSFFPISNSLFNNDSFSYTMVCLNMITLFGLFMWNLT